MKSIYLIGFMGSGKTSTAKKLSDLIDVPYLDTDVEIEKLTGSDIPSIFATKGESYFREKETEVLLDLPVSDCVIATGGGIIGKEGNREIMKERGIVIFLDTAWSTIEERLGVDPTRPLWNEKGKKTLFDLRQKIYKETADIIVNTDDKEPEGVAEEIISKVKQSS